eukprot:scaffold8011_cov149-Amphora_coffeaeformis.AAC.1
MQFNFHVVQRTRSTIRCGCCTRLSCISHPRIVQSKILQRINSVGLVQEIVGHECVRCAFPRGIMLTPPFVPGRTRNALVFVAMRVSSAHTVFQSCFSCVRELVPMREHATTANVIVCIFLPGFLL